MRNNLNVIQNLFKIRDEIINSNDYVESVVNMLSFVMLDGNAIEGTLWEAFQSEFPEDAERLWNSNEKPLYITDPYGMFYIEVQRITADNAEYPIFNITMLSKITAGQSNYQTTTSIPFRAGEADSLENDLYWSFKSDTIEYQEMSVIALLQRLSDGAQLNQAVLLINDLIVQNGTTTLDSINARIEAMGIQDNDWVRQLIVNIANHDRLTSQAWVTILHQMYNDNKEALEENSLQLDESKLNVIQGFMIFGTAEVIGTIVNIVSILLAAVTKGISLLIGYLVQSFNAIKADLSESGNFKIDLSSSNSYFDIPIMAWKRPLSGLGNYEEWIPGLLDNGYAKYVPTPFADYYFWISDGMLYANAFLKLNAAPSELRAFSNLGTKAVCGLEHLRASVSSLSGDTLIKTTSDPDQLVRAFSTSVLGFMLQHMEGIYQYNVNEGHHGLHPFFQGGTFNFSEAISEDWTVIIKEGDEYSGDNLSGEWILPRVGAGYIMAIIAQHAGKPTPTWISEIYRVLRAMTNFCTDHGNGHWFFPKAVDMFLPASMDKVSFDCGLQVKNQVGSIIISDLTYTIDLNYYNTLPDTSGLSNSIIWLGCDPWNGLVTGHVFNPNVSSFPNIDDDVLWSDIWADDTLNAFDNDLIQVNDVDAIPSDRMITSPTVDINSVAEALLIIGAITLVTVAVGALVIKKFRTYKMKKTLQRKATLDKYYQQYTRASGSDKDYYRDQLINKSRQYNRLASIFGWRQYDITSGTYVPLGTISNASASILTSFSKNLLNSDETINNKLDEGFTMIVNKIGN